MSLLRRTVSPPEGNVNLAFGGVTLPYNSRTMPRIEDLELLRTIGDPLADNSLDVLLRRSHSGDPASMAKGGCPAGNMVQALMARVGEITRLENPLQPGPEFSITDVLSKCTDEDDRAILAMWESVSTVPTWLDWELLERGQDASHRYAPLLLYILAMGSLATGYASSVIDQTLAATGYLSSSSRSSVMRRLAETGHMTVLMARGVKAMNVGGCGWKAVINVRYLHAMVRRRIMAKSPAFASQYGIPVNQTDMVSTLFAFTSSVVVHLETFGVPMSDEHSRGYLHLWAYAGHLLGVRTDLNYLIPVDALTQAIAAAKRAGSPAPGAITPNPILATDPLAFGHVLGTALREHLFFPSDMTKELTCRLLDGISDQFPFNIPLSRLQTVLYHLLQNTNVDVKATYGVPKPTLYDQIEWKVVLLLMFVLIRVLELMPRQVRALVDNHAELVSDAMFAHHVGKVPIDVVRRAIRSRDGREMRAASESFGWAMRPVE